jgi:hypothetical protein
MEYLDPLEPFESVESVDSATPITSGLPDECRDEARYDPGNLIGLVVESRKLSFARVLLIEGDVEETLDLGRRTLSHEEKLGELLVGPTGKTFSNIGHD